MHHLCFVIMFLAYITASHTNAVGLRQPLQVVHVQKLESNEEGWHCRIASQMFGFLHHHSLFFFHQGPLFIPSTGSPKAVPAAALLNAHRNVLTANMFGNDDMEIIMGQGKDCWGVPCSSCVNLQWPFNYQAAVPMFPPADIFFPS